MPFGFKAAYGYEPDVVDIALERDFSVRDFPKRVVSMNLCTDQYLLLLAAPNQIQSVSYLSHSAEDAYYYERARQYPANHGYPEEVVSFNPDLILTGVFSTRIASRLLGDMGYPVELFGHPASISEIMQQILRMGGLLGRSAIAEKVVAGMKARLTLLVTNQPAIDPRFSLLQFSPGGYTVGDESLEGEVMALSGWYNKAKDADIQTIGQLGLEEMLLLEPLALIDSPLAPGTFSYAESMLEHPVLKKVLLPRYSVQINRLLWACGGPAILDAIVELRKQRENIVRLELDRYDR